MCLFSGFIQVFQVVAAEAVGPKSCAFKLVSLTQVVVQVIKYGIYTQIHSLNSGRQANPKGPQYIWVFCPTG